MADEANLAMTPKTIASGASRLELPANHLAPILALAIWLFGGSFVRADHRTEANRVIQIEMHSGKPYANAFNQTNLMASVEANSNAEAGIILRYQDPDNYLVGLYSPLFKAMYIYDRQDGDYRGDLGKVSIPEVGPRIKLTAAACGEHVAITLTDGKKSYHTPIVKVDNVASGKAGLWFCQIGDGQVFDNFELSQTQFGPTKLKPTPKPTSGPATEYHSPQLPSPQDWVLVLEREKP